MRRFACCLIALFTLVLWAPQAWAQVHQHENEAGTPMVRSLESLRDLDYDSWQAVAYREGPPGEPVVLRIVGYPGKVRLEHPVSLQVIAGRREWALEDITLANPALASDGREAAAEAAEGQRELLLQQVAEFVVNCLRVEAVDPRRSDGGVHGSRCAPRGEEDRLTMASS